MALGGWGRRKRRNKEIKKKTTPDGVGEKKKSGVWEKSGKEEWLKRPVKIKKRERKGKYTADEILKR